MEKPLKREFDAQTVRKSFSRVYRFYDFWSDLTESKAAGWLIKNAELKDKMNILDAGTGTGKILKKIVRFNPNGYNAGIDLSADMLKMAKKKLQKTGANFELQEASAYKLPFNNEKFDILICNYVLDLLPTNDYGKILNEFKRVMKNKGELLLSTMTFGRSTITRLWDMMARKFPSALTGCRPVMLGDYLEESGFKIIRKDYIVQNTFPSEVIKAIKI